jgi:hypothetical protein
MKKQIVTAVILTLIAYESISQTSRDTVCLPVAQVRAAINLIEKGKVMEDELRYTRNAINILENRLIIKDSVISTLILKENAYKSVFENYKKTISNNEQVVENLNKALTLEKRKFRKQGISKWIGAAGAFTLGVLIAK